MRAWIVFFVAAIAAYYAAVKLQRRKVPTWIREPIGAAVSPNPKTILVTGATGFIGRHWCRALIERGDRLIVLTRNAHRARDLFGPHAEIVTSLDQIGSSQRIDAIVNLAGAPIMGAPWTKRRRELLLSSRLNTTEAVVQLIERLERRPSVLVSMSAVGYYGVRDDEEVTEADRGRPIFQSSLCQAWEVAAERATQLDVRVCRLRAGIVLGRSGGALPQLARSAALRVALVLGSGTQWISWIHIDDLVRLIARCVDDETWSGAFNATAPEPVRQEQFARALAGRFGRALMLRLPDRTLRSMLGEMAQLLVDGQRVVPFKALNRGFRFDYPTLDAALAALFPKADHAQLRDAAEILYDPVCPVCNLEMRRYCREAQRRGLPWRFTDAAASSTLLACGIDSDTARRRVYVVDSNGRMVSGLDALAHIWSTLPGWRWLARVVRLPIASRLANLAYDLMLAPLIWRWSTWRRARGVKAEPLMRS